MFIPAFAGRRPTGAVRRRRRRRESRIPCDRRERGMVRRATVGSATDGTAPQGKVARKCPRSRRQEVSRASGYNLASSVFGSVRCRGVSPVHGTPKLPRLPRRVESAEARDGECGTCSIEAHAGVRSETGRGSVGDKGGEGLAAWPHSWAGIQAAPLYFTAFTVCLSGFFVSLLLRTIS